MKEVPSARRLERLLYVLLVWACLIVGRLVSLQVLQHDELQRQADTQHYKTIPIPSLRGAILDRNGQILATDVRTPSLFAEPRRIIDQDEAVELLTTDGVIGAHRGAMPLWIFLRPTPLTRAGRGVRALTAGLGRDFANDILHIRDVVGVDAAGTQGRRQSRPQ